ncbi:MAG: penicillin-binding protein 2 [candidate division WOR-3 bacterium]|nr:penicillin-binding protein 2 [candidate division WOR-3 bacterium]MCX7836583.1 penicillin-binding protein 2 [candidate division WOR-3 bacterium]MDW8114165.1 penicillin-binding protein 2 [candidate division WOR-3 bacterium]
MKRKFKNFILFIIFLFSLIFLRVFYLQVLKGERYERLAYNQRIRKVILRAQRGKIYDSKGFLIADTKLSYNLAILTQEVDTNFMFQYLPKILNIDLNSLREKVKEYKNYPYPVLIKRNLSKEEAIKLEENLIFKEGIRIEITPRRIYPFKHISSSAIGYLNEVSKEDLKDTLYNLGDLIGRYGIEGYYEKILRGKNGLALIEVDARGREIQPFSLAKEIPAIPGADIYLSLDMNLNLICDSLLNNYPSGLILGVEPNTGRIIIFVTKPNFDPNIFLGLNHKEWQKLIKNKRKPLFSRIVGGVYPPGSTFKPFITLQALTKGIINKDYRFSPCYGKYKIGKRIFKCWQSHGSLNLIDALAYSCNIYFYQLGMKMGLKEILKLIKALELQNKSNIDILEEVNSRVPDYQTAPLGKIANLSIGQGEISLTPIKLAQLYCGIFNEGLIPRLHFLDSIKNTKFFHLTFLDSLIKKNIIKMVINDKKETLYQYIPQFYPMPFSKEAIAIVKEGLLAVVKKGTGINAEIGSLKIYGKTGTAQNPFGKDHAWFIGYGEKEDKRLLILILLENIGAGGAYAAPLAREIFLRYFFKNEEREISFNN